MQRKKTLFCTETWRRAAALTHTLLLLFLWEEFSSLLSANSPTVSLPLSPIILNVVFLPFFFIFIIALQFTQSIRGNYKEESKNCPVWIPHDCDVTTLKYICLQYINVWLFLQHTTAWSSNWWRLLLLSIVSLLEQKLWGFFFSWLSERNCIFA